MPPIKGIDAKTERGGRRARPRDERAVRRARVQDHDRPVRRQAHLLPRLLGRARSRLVRATTRVKDKQRAHRPPPADARQQARGDQGGPRRRHRRRGRPQGHHHRRHALRPNNPIVLERMDFPEPVISIAIEPKTKADQEKLGVALQQARPGGSDVPRRAPTGDGPDDHRGHGRAAPRDHRRPHEARVQGRRQRRQAAGRLPRDDHAAGAEVEDKLHAPDRRPRPVRPRQARGRAAAEPGKGYEFENKIVGGAIPKEYIPGVEKGIDEAMDSGVARRLSRWSTSRSTLVDGSYHEVDSNEMAFKIAGSMAPSRKAPQGRARCCSSRS